MNTAPSLSKTLPLLALIFFFLALIAMVLWQNAGGSNPLFALFNAVPHFDKVGHFVLMGLLSFLAVLASARTAKEITKRRILLPIVLVTLLVTVEELSQIYIPSRTFSLPDLFFSCLGVALFGAFAAHLAAAKRKEII